MGTLGGIGLISTTQMMGERTFLRRMSTQYVKGWNEGILIIEIFRETLWMRPLWRRIHPLRRRYQLQGRDHNNPNKGITQ